MCRSVHNHSNVSYKSQLSKTSWQLQSIMSQKLFKVFVFVLTSHVLKTVSPLISGFISDALLDSWPCFYRMLLQLINIPRWFLINIFLYDSTYPIICWIEVRTVRRTLWTFAMMNCSCHDFWSWIYKWIMHSYCSHWSYFFCLLIMCMMYHNYWYNSFFARYFHSLLCRYFNWDAFNVNWKPGGEAGSWAF